MDHFDSWDQVWAIPFQFPIQQPVLILLAVRSHWSNRQSKLYQPFGIIFKPVANKNSIHKLLLTPIRA